MKGVISGGLGLSGHIPLGEDPRTDPENFGGTIPTLWYGDVWGIAQNEMESVDGEKECPGSLPDLFEPFWDKWNGGMDWMDYMTLRRHDEGTHSSHSLKYEGGHAGVLLSRMCRRRAWCNKYGVEIVISFTEHEEWWRWFPDDCFCGDVIALHI
ncbi:hypothetical protein AMECASPLE_011012 [Ameca splendens]|uniref:Uncharacterized protein n=1 Tax=Ameca splendens TaxID=208324 RepID=A0ABV0YMS0_9TELE